MTAPRHRLDSELVHRGLARSRRRAAVLVAEGRVLVAGEPARKASQPIGADSPVIITGTVDPYVARSAHKLDGALEALAGLSARVPKVQGRRCLDAGASTGGFTQVLLERGAAHVTAVDVGHGQMAPEIRDDPRVTAVDGCNIRDLHPDELPGPAADLVVADLSFISLRLVIPVLLAVAAVDADHLVMVKPQFEVGRERLGRGGVVTSPDLQVEAVLGVAAAAGTAGAAVLAVVPSGTPGEHGNREFFLWLTRSVRPTIAPTAQESLARAVHTAVNDGAATVLEDAS